MKILCIGDIVSSPGRSAVRDYLADHKNDYDLIVANAENAAGGVGLTADVTETILNHGVDVLTSGNHIWKKNDFVELMAEAPDEYPVLRPANYPKDPPGRGHRIFKVNGYRVLIVNLQGRTFMDSIDCPFRTGESILENEHYDISLVDFHAEATSEKVALAKHLSEHVTIFVGTHTHVQTADERIMNDMAYISDLGMTGPEDSIIGVRDELATKRFLTGRPNRFKVEKQGPRILNALSITVDADENTSTSLERIYERMPQRQN
jgi:metallophosphoesterase (TIGR00282 family)